jgi:hypothetical protein
MSGLDVSDIARMLLYESIQFQQQTVSATALVYRSVLPCCQTQNH